MSTSPSVGSQTCPSSIAFHAIAIDKREPVYYAAVADPWDNGIVLNFKPQDLSNRKVKEMVQEMLSLPNGPANPIQASGSMTRHHFISTREPLPIGDRLARIESVFITCEIPAVLRGVPTASAAIPDIIGAQCSSFFTSMKPEVSFFKVQAGNKFYDATPTLESGTQAVFIENLRELS